MERIEWRMRVWMWIKLWLAKNRDMNFSWSVNMFKMTWPDDEMHSTYLVVIYIRRCQSDIWVCISNLFFFLILHPILCKLLKNKYRLCCDMYKPGNLKIKNFLFENFTENGAANFCFEKASFNLCTKIRRKGQQHWFLVLQKCVN